MKSRIAPRLLTGMALMALLTSMPQAESSAKGKTDAPRPVEGQLLELTKQAEQSAPPEVIEAGKQGTRELRSSGIVDKALNVGASIPSFTLSDAHGRQVKSADLLEDGPMVLVFYRGAWCPFCNLYLRSIQEYLPQIKEQGATLVAVSGETPDNTLSVEEKNELTFTVLSDPNFDVAREFGIVYEMPRVTNDAILKLGFDLTKYYSTKKPELPLSATYVIDRKGKITYAFLDPDYKKRAEPADILAALSRMK